MLIKHKQLVTIDIFYYMPDYVHLVQEFIWQTEDFVPELNRTHKFLNYWHHNIDAVIQEILLSVNDKKYGTFRSVDEIFQLN